METWHQNRYHHMRFSPNFEMLHFCPSIPNVWYRLYPAESHIFTVKRGWMRIHTSDTHQACKNMNTHLGSWPRSTEVRESKQQGLEGADGPRHGGKGEWAFCQKKQWGTLRLPASFVSSQIQKQRPIMQNKFYRKTEAGGGGGDWKIHVRWGFFFPFFLNPIRELIIISLLAEKPNKWQEKESQLHINTHTLTHTKMKDLLSFKGAANFPSFKGTSEKDAANECAFSTGSLINFSPFHLPPPNPFSFLIENKYQM